ncbi:hypothetical protein CEP45_00955 [Mergibacter septicus]|uniref:hypothetical protein n=1 Tax=Mergibacter septicus TaxID=221402 RepID=UPI001C75F3CA|nr:hypothetical protein [Mergibacter septicus]QDJ12498.1 hypothetical protein CEP45_00955 [Mergibacter septicus]
MKAKGKAEKKVQTFPIGVIYKQQCFYAAWFEAEKIRFFQTNDITVLQQHLNEVLKKLKIAYKNCCLITSIPSHLCWHTQKSIPYQFNNYEIYLHVMNLLKQELPQDNEEIWFDYNINGQRLDLYAIKRNYATDITDQFLPLAINVLDIFPHVLLRAFKYFSTSNQTDTLFCYYTEQQLYFLLETAENLFSFSSSLATKSNFSQITQQISPKLTPSLSHCIIYQNVNLPALNFDFLPPQCRIEYLKSEIGCEKFLALGCALWGIDRK